MKRILFISFFLFLFAIFTVAKSPYFFVRVNKSGEFINFLLNSEEMKEFVGSPAYNYFSTTRIFLKLKRRIKKYSDFTGIHFGRDFIKSVAGKNIYIWGYDISDTIFVYESDVSDFLNTPLFSYVTKKFNVQDFNGNKIFFLKWKKLTFALTYIDGHLFISNSLVYLKKNISDFSSFSTEKFFIGNDKGDSIYDVYINLKMIKRTPHFKKYYRFKGEYENYENGVISLYKTDYGFCERRIFFNGKGQEVSLPHVTFLTDGNLSVIREEKRENLLKMLSRDIFEVGDFPGDLKFSLSKKSGEFTLIDRGVLKVGEEKETTLFKKSLDGIAQILSKLGVIKVFYLSRLFEVRESLKWHGSSNGVLIILRDKVMDEDIKNLIKLLKDASTGAYLVGDVSVKDLGNNIYLINPVEVGKSIYLSKLGDQAILISNGKFIIDGEKIKTLTGLKGNIFEVNLTHFRNFFKKYSPVIEGGSGTIFYDVLPSLFNVFKRVRTVQVLKFFKGDDEVVFAFYKVIPSVK